MKLKVINPITALIVESSLDEMNSLTKLLTYTNTANLYLLKRHSLNRQWKRSSPDGWLKRLEELKKDVKKTLIFKDDQGRPYIRPASISYLKDDLNIEVENLISYPTPKPVPWAKKLPFELKDYQKQSKEKLIEAKHANVQITTGGGKTAAILSICRDTGFKTAIIVPSRSIFHEVFEAFETHFGKGKIGKFGDGKKVIGKRFTVCIGKSIANIKPNTPEWEFFSNLDMLCVDESHTWGAESLEEICHGVLSNVPYRTFFSATQTRGDGAVALLQSIIGPTVHILSTKQAIEEGHICPHEFNIVSLNSSNAGFTSSDPLEIKRIHFLNNKNIANFIARIANADATINGRQTLVLVEELSQIKLLLPLLKIPYVVAHSESNKERLKELGFSKVDPTESVETFNKNEAKLLIGTSCISTGTNIFPTHNTFNWCGGSSEIETKQGPVGRSVRFMERNPWKDNCSPKPKSIIWDFKVNDISVLDKHLEKRISYYEDSGSQIREIDLNATKTKKTGGV